MPTFVAISVIILFYAQAKVVERSIHGYLKISCNHFLPTFCMSGYNGVSFPSYLVSCPWVLVSKAVSVFLQNISSIPVQYYSLYSALCNNPDSSVFSFICM